MGKGVELKAGYGSEVKASCAMRVGLAPTLIRQVGDSYSSQTVVSWRRIANQRKLSLAKYA
jgi:hypothetical protein